MYKNFRVGGGIVLGLSALVLGLVGYTSHLDRHIDNIKKLNETDNFKIKSGETFGLCNHINDINENDSYVFCYKSGSDRLISGVFKDKYVTSINALDANSSALGIISFKSNGTSNNYYLKFKDSSNEGFLSTTAARSMKIASEANASTWNVSISEAGVFTCTSSTSSYGTIQYNSGSPRFLNYASGQNEISLYRLLANDDKAAFKREVKTDSNIAFKYTYLEKGKEEVLYTVDKGVTSSGSTDLGNGTFSYSADPKPYSDGSAKFNTTGHYYELALKEPVDNPFVSLNYQLYAGTQSAPSSLVFSFYDSNNEVKGSFIYDLGTDTSTYIGINTKEKSLSLTNIKKIRFEFTKVGYNCAIKDVVFSAGENIVSYSNFNSVNVQLWMDYKNTLESITETGMIVTAKNGFTIENGIISLPTEPYIKIFVNSTLEDSFFAKVTFTNEEIAKYYESTITFTPFAKINDEYVFAASSTTSLKAEVEKISNVELKNSFIANYNL